MIKRVYIKDLVTFDEVSLELKNGLIVFTGPSGAGKSLLMQAILANLGHGTSEARLCEIEMSQPDIESDEYLLSDPTVIKALRKDRSRYYIDGQNISHKKLKELMKKSVKYLSVRDKSNLDSHDLTDMVDRYISERESSYSRVLDNYKNIYLRYRKDMNELCLKKEEAKRVNELIEFTRFEIDKISSIDPKPNEYDELMDIKQKLSKIDRVKEAIKKASIIFEYEQNISEVYSLMGESEQFFTDTMNQIRIDFERFEDKALELEDIDIEYVLDRLEKLHSLVKRYDSIEGALKYKQNKQKELEAYLNIEHDLSKLEDRISTQKEELMSLALNISQIRKQYIPIIEKELSNILAQLKLPQITITSYTSKEPVNDGIDILNIKMGKTPVSSLSGGEFNRLRLALMSLSSPQDSSKEVIFLDEIDANVSGDESIAIAQMITNLSKNRQVFAISHQPHLSSQANLHILVQKSKDKSHATILERRGRIKEVARIIGGENADNEATAFAKKLIGRHSNSKLFGIDNNRNRSVI